MNMRELGDVVRFLTALRQEQSKFPNGPMEDLVAISKKFDYIYRNASNASTTNEDLDMDMEFSE